jgi:hypothetical protein
MAQSGYTPILIYASGTASALPSAANLTSSANGAELALNYADGKLYYKNSSGVVTLLANAATAAGSPPGGSNTQVQYNNSGAFGGSANFVWDNSNVRLGIGTSSPATKLDVRGTPGADYGIANIFDTTSAASGVGGVLALSGYKTTTSGAAIFAKIKGIKENATAGNEAGALTFETNSGSAYTERMRIDSSGNMLMGTTSNLAYSGLVFNMKSSGSYVGLNASSSEARVFATWDTTAIPMTFYMGGTERMRISSTGGFSVGTTANPGAGAIYATGNITAYYSDKRLKTIESTIPNALDKVSKLQGVYYTNNEVAAQHGYTSQERQVGLLAQDLEEVLPEVVKAAPFDLDQDGSSKSGEHYKTVQYERVIPLLVEAIKELRAEIKALKG